MRHGLVRNFAGAVRAVEPVEQQEFVAARHRVIQCCGLDRVAEGVLVQPLQHRNRGVKRAVGRALGPLAVPAAVGHLLAQQVLDDAMHAVVRTAEITQEGQGHAGDARLAMFERLEEVDAAVAVEAGVQQQFATPPPLGVFRWQAQVT